MFTFNEEKKHHKIILIATHRVAIVLVYKSLFVEGNSHGYNCTTLSGVQYLSMARSRETKKVKLTKTKTLNVILNV